MCGGSGGDLYQQWSRDEGHSGPLGWDRKVSGLFPITSPAPSLPCPVEHWLPPSWLSSKASGLQAVLLWSGRLLGTVAYRDHRILLFLTCHPDWVTLELPPGKPVARRPCPYPVTVANSLSSVVPRAEEPGIDDWENPSHANTAVWACVSCALWPHLPAPSQHQDLTRPLLFSSHQGHSSQEA